MNTRRYFTTAWIGIVIGVVAVMVIVVAVHVFAGDMFGASPSRTKWTDDEARSWLRQKWDEHCKRYGQLSNNVCFAYTIDTNASFAVMADGSKVELGFRDDGVVVWRPKP